MARGSRKKKGRRGPAASVAVRTARVREGADRERTRTATRAPAEERRRPASTRPTGPEGGRPAAPEGPQPTRRALGLFGIGRIDFVSRRKWFAIFSGTLLAISVVSLAIGGLNFGIDFTGGNAYALEFPGPIVEAELRTTLQQAGISGAVIRVDRSEPNHVMLRTPYLETEAEEAMMAALQAAYGGFEASAGDAVSPTIGSELLKDALIGTLLACLGILIYIAVRFEHRFAAASIVALVHDTVITVGLFSVLRLEVNASFVAAILTIVGYSVNDTIVVFDRVRDNLKRRGKEGLEALCNRSLNETFVRSVNTSVTAFLAVTAIFLFGGVTTRDFALALMFGIFIGTYSSICVATPVWLWWRKRDERALAAASAKSLSARAR